MSIKDAFNKGYSRNIPAPKRSLMPIINKLQNLQPKPKTAGYASAPLDEKKKKKGGNWETGGSKGSGLRSNKSASMTNTKRR